MCALQEADRTGKRLYHVCGPHANHKANSAVLVRQGNAPWVAHAPPLAQRWNLHCAFRPPSAFPSFKSSCLCHHPPPLPPVCPPPGAPDLDHSHAGSSSSRALRAHSHNTRTHNSQSAHHSASPPIPSMRTLRRQPASPTPPPCIQIGMFQVLFLGRNAEDAAAAVDRHRPFVPFRDASCGVSTFHLTVLDCLRGIQKARDVGFIDWNSGASTWSIDEYEHFEQVRRGPLRGDGRKVGQVDGAAGCLSRSPFHATPTHRTDPAAPLAASGRPQVENGDLNWIVPGKLAAFSGPASRNNEVPGYRLFTPEDYLPYFRSRRVGAVVRLNKRCYDARRFKVGPGPVARQKGSRGAAKGGTGLEGGFMACCGRGLKRKGMGCICVCLAGLGTVGIRAQ
eukprot:365654-Chlamydomonas_euryale.AAC.3